MPCSLHAAINSLVLKTVIGEKAVTKSPHRRLRLSTRMYGGAPAVTSAEETVYNCARLLKRSENKSTSVSASGVTKREGAGVVKSYCGTGAG